MSYTLQEFKSSHLEAINRGALQSPTPSAVNAQSSHSAFAVEELDTCVDGRAIEAHEQERIPCPIVQAALAALLGSEVRELPS